MRILCAISVKNSRFLQIQMYVNITIILVSTATGKQQHMQDRQMSLYFLINHKIIHAKSTQ